MAIQPVAQPRDDALAREAHQRAARKPEAVAHDVQREHDEHAPQHRALRRVAVGVGVAVRGDDLFVARAGSSGG